MRNGTTSEPGRNGTAPRPLQRRSRVPVWRQIKTDLLVEIQNGLYAPGDPLPTEQELSAVYGVNRHTVRLALGELAQSGAIVIWQGRGSFVAEEPFEYAITRDAKWSEVERQLAVSPNGRLVDLYRRPASPRLARLLEVPLARMRFRDERQLHKSPCESGG